MQITPEQAQFLLQVQLPTLENEHGITTKVLKAIPPDKADYKPEGNSMTAFDLAWHIAYVANQFLASLPGGEIRFNPLEKPKSMDELLEFFEDSFKQDVAAIKAMTGEQLAKIVGFAGAFQLPAVSYIGFSTSHEIHHRGQLSVYLRPMGAKVPSMYGESYDAKQERLAAAG